MRKGNPHSLGASRLGEPGAKRWGRTRASRLEENSRAGWPIQMRLVDRRDVRRVQQEGKREKERELLTSSGQESEEEMDGGQEYKEGEVRK